MEFRLDEAQVELQRDRRAGSAPTGSRSTPSRARGAADRPRPLGELAELGVFGLLLAEDAGGIGLGVVEARDRLRAARLAPRARSGAVDRRSPRRSSTAPPTASALVGGVDAATSSTAPVVVEHAAELDVLLVVARRRRGRASHRPALPAPEPLDAARPAHARRPVRRPRRRRAWSAAPTRPRGCGCSAPCSARRMLVGVGVAGARGRPRLRPRARAVRRADRLVPGGQAPARRHVRPRPASPRAPPTLPPRWSQDPGDDDPAERRRAAKLLAGEAADRQRRHRGPGARRHGLHLGHAPEPPAQAGLGARAGLRHADDHARRLGAA